MSFLVIQKLKKLLNQKKLSTSVGDEGGFAPSLDSDQHALDFIIQAIEKSGFVPGKDFNLCLDVAANEIYDGKVYSIENNIKTEPMDMISYYEKLASKYPIKSIEDPYLKMTGVLGKNLRKKLETRFR